MKVCKALISGHLRKDTDARVEPISLDAAWSANCSFRDFKPIHRSLAFRIRPVGLRYIATLQPKCEAKDNTNTNRDCQIGEDRQDHRQKE